jgi:hypothetical protein
LRYSGDHFFIAGQEAERSFIMTGWRDFKYDLWKPSGVIPSSRGIGGRMSLIILTREYLVRPHHFNCPTGSYLAILKTQTRNKRKVGWGKILK